jgi:hypothetical protein
LQRHQFEAYLEKVFDLSAQVGAMREGRKSPRHPWKKVFDAVFLGAAIQIPRLHRVEAECRQGVLKRRIGKLSEDAMGYALERQDPAAVFALGCDVARRMKRNGLLGSSWARGRIVAAVDGIEICSSYVRCCDACMEREVEHKVDGQLRKDVQYYHRIVAVVVVSADFPVPLGIRFQKDGETEVACAVELLRDLHRQLGRRFFDLLVADALYLQKPFVKIVEGLGWNWVITLKENQPELLAEAQRLTSGAAAMTESNPPEELQLWHAPEVYWPVADRSVRVVKTFRIQKRNRVQLRPADSPEPPTARTGGEQHEEQPVAPPLENKEPPGAVSEERTAPKKRKKEPFQQESTNYYASNLELGSIPFTFIPQLGRSRWRIDTEAFQTLTTQAHLKNPSVHQSGALVVLTMIRVLAYTLTLAFYHRQVVSHARQAPPTFSEMARLLGYLFLPPGLDSS